MQLRMLLLALLAAPLATADVTYVYLTWQNDTSTTMTVNWQTNEKPKNPQVHWDTASRSDAGDYGNSVSATSQRIDSRNDVRWAHHAEITGLEPGETVYFRAGDKRNGLSDERKFRTIPAGNAPIRFATGGDMEFTELTKRLVAVAAAQEPAFIAIGGDVAYANGNPRLISNWDRWFRIWTTEAISPQGFTIPLSIAIGNHEVFGQFEQSIDRAPYYFGFFRQADTSYFVQRYGENFAILYLDTSHVAHHESQVPFIREQLAAHADRPFTFALYHVPLYPSVRLETGKYETLGRTHWAPVFDEFGLTAAFENHDHALKRTKLLKGGEAHPEGTLYLGDGCFGQDPRELVNHPRPYMAHAASAPHVWVVDVTQEKVTYRAVDQNGTELDRATSR